MISIDNADLDTYCGRIGNLYGRYRLSPPFELRRIAADWKANGIALSHIVAVIDRHLTDHRRRYNSGSGDALFSWLDEFIRKTWHEQHLSPPQAEVSRPTMKRIAAGEWIDRQPSADHEVDARRSATGREAPVGNWSGAPACGRADQAPPQSTKSIGHKQKQPKRIDQAIAFLRRELANGEVAATRLEEKAKANGIAENTRPCPRPAQRYMSPYGLRQVRKILAVAAYNAMNDFMTPRES